MANNLKIKQGFEAIKRLLTQQTQPYNILLGARNTTAAKQAYDALSYTKSSGGGGGGSSVTVLPCELNNLNTVKSFAKETLEKLGETKMDYLLLNAGIGGPADQPGVLGSQWCEPLLVNHICEFLIFEKT